MNTYIPNLSANDWIELIAQVCPFGGWPFDGRAMDDFKYELPYPLPCRIIYKAANSTNYYIEVTFNKQGKIQSYDNNPAVIMKWEYTESYYMNDGQLHNTTGPAYIGRHVNVYALKGKPYDSFDDWTNNLHNYMPNEDVLAIKLKGELT